MFYKSRFLVIALLVAALFLLPIQLLSAASNSHISELAEGSLIDSCFATNDDGVTVMSSADSQAVQDSVDAADSGDIVKIAGRCTGVSSKTVFGNPISQTVFIDKSLSLQGGFTTTNWSAAPDSVAHPTILDASSQGRVVVLMDQDSGRNEILIDNLTLQNGNARGNTYPFGADGAGLFVGSSEVTISNILLKENSAESTGGAMKVSENSNVIIDNSKLSNNYAAGTGAGIRNDGRLEIEDSEFERNTVGSSGGAIKNNGSLFVENVLFIENSAGSGAGIENAGQADIQDSYFISNKATVQGGGISNFNDLILSASVLQSNTADDGAGIFNGLEATVRLRDSMILNNAASFDGGGMFNAGTATINTSTLSGNSANRGGGIKNQSSSSPLAKLFLNESTLKENTATVRGGAISNLDTATIIRSTFQNNSSHDGGVIFNGGTASFENSSLSGNSVTGSGGAIRNLRTIHLKNSTLTGNEAAISGGGISNWGGVNINNSIVANSNNAGDCAGIGNFDTTYSLVEDGSCGSTGGTGNIPFEDPGLGVLQDNGGPTFTHALAIDSPALNMGDDMTCTVTDQRRFLRHDGDCDMGAFEAVGSLEASCAATADNGFSQYVSLDASAVVSATEQAIGGGIVKIAGICSGVEPSIIAGGSITQTLYVSKSLTLEGGYVPNMWAEPPNGVLRPTTLNADNKGRVIVLNDEAGGGDMTVEIRHLTIENGLADREELLIPPFLAHGGGLFVSEGVEATVQHSLIHGNAADFIGGGVYNEGVVTLSEAVVERNSAISGGGIFSINKLNIYSSTLSGNVVSGIAGAVYSEGEAVIESSMLEGNSAESSGGAILNAGNMTITTSTLRSNSSDSSGGAIHNPRNMLILASTFQDNRARLEGGAIYNTGTVEIDKSLLQGNSAFEGSGFFNNFNAHISNSTFSENDAYEGGGIYNDGTGVIEVTYSTLYSNTAFSVGGGIYNTGSFTLTNSINAGSVIGGDCFNGNSISVGHSLIEDASCGAGSGNADNNLSGEPLLDLLADNGGSTQTHALKEGSPAIGKANQPDCVASPINGEDQRGEMRDGNCDMGAYEDFGALPTAVALVSLETQLQPASLIPFVLLLLLSLLSGILVARDSIDIKR